MTLHAPSPLGLGIAVCGQRRSKFGATVTCVKCVEAMRRVRAVQQKQKEVTHAPPVAVPSAADVNGGNDIEVGTRVEDGRAAPLGTSGGGVVFGTSAAAVPGTVVRKWPHEYAFRYIHWLANGQFVITKYASPVMPAFT